MNKEKYVNAAREYLDYALDEVSYGYKKKMFLERQVQNESEVM